MVLSELKSFRDTEPSVSFFVSIFPNMAATRLGIFLPVALVLRATRPDSHPHYRGVHHLAPCLLLMSAAGVRSAVVRPRDMETVRMTFGFGVCLQDLRERHHDRLLGAPLARRSDLVGKQSLLQVLAFFFSCQPQRCHEVSGHSVEVAAVSPAGLICPGGSGGTV